MILHGFFITRQQLKDIAQPIISLLNGSNDIYKKDTTGLQGDQTKTRYMKSIDNEIIVEGKMLACEILITISQIETDAKCTLIMGKIKQQVISNENQRKAKLRELNTSFREHGNKIHSMPDESNEELQNMDMIKAIAWFKNFEVLKQEEYICMLFDLMLYRYPTLVKEVFQLLVMYFTRQRTVIESLLNIQLLQGEKGQTNLTHIKKTANELKKLQNKQGYWLLKNNDDGNRTKDEVALKFKEMADICVEEEKQIDEINIRKGSLDITEDELDAENSPGSERSDLSNDGGSPDINRSPRKNNGLTEKEHKAREIQMEEFILYQEFKGTISKENQRLLRNFKLAEMAILFLKTKVDRETNRNEHYTNMIKAIYNFLVGFVRENKQNQTLLYDQLEVFMKHIDRVPIAAQLVQEIYRDNKKFLTLNVNKYLRTIVNFGREAPLESAKKGMYMRFLEVFCVMEGTLVRPNQSEIIDQLTTDYARSNILFFFQDQGQKELQNLIDQLNECKLEKDEESSPIKRIIKHQKSIIIRKSLQRADTSKSDNRNLVSSIKRKETFTKKNSLNQKDLRKQEHQVVSMPIFNIMQFMRLISLCCEGKSDQAELVCQEYILTFAMALKIFKMLSKVEKEKAQNQFWPLKKLILVYVWNTFLDSNDKDFLSTQKKKSSYEEDDFQAPSKDQEQSVVNILLDFVTVINADCEALTDIYEQERIIGQHVPKTQNNLYIYPDETIEYMMPAYEEYVFSACTDFLKQALKRKGQNEFGDRELIFYFSAKSFATLYDKIKPNDKGIAYKQKTWELLNFIKFQGPHSKYLRNVGHCARRKDTMPQDLKELVDSQKQEEAAKALGTSKSSLLSQKILSLANNSIMQNRNEKEFEELVRWIVNINERMESMKNGGRGFENVSFKTVITAILRLLDARVLDRDLQIVGIKIIRKIIEIENENEITPAADWEEYEEFMPKIEHKQLILMQAGTIEFLCKHFAEEEDDERKEECLLVCIALCLGGNKLSQDIFLKYMLADKENCFLEKLFSMLQHYFEQCKKFLTEKNAKLEVTFKMRQKMNAFQNQGAVAFGQKQMNKEDLEDGEDSDDNLMQIEDSFSDEEEEENNAVSKPKKQLSPEQLDEKMMGKESVVQTTIRILRFCQLLCEGHHKLLQSHLRVQVCEDGLETIKSFNFIGCISFMLGQYVKNYVNCYSTELGKQMIDTLVELVQGPCKENQLTLVEFKTIDCCRDLLQQGDTIQDMEKRGFIKHRKADLDDLKMKSVDLLLAIIEGQTEQEMYEKVASSMDDFSIVTQRMEFVYTSFVNEELQIDPAITHNPDPRLAEKAFEKILKACKEEFGGNVIEGFNIYSLINQLAEMLPETKELLLKHKYKEKYYYKFFHQNSGQIEARVENQLQRLYFPIQPICRNLTQLTKDKFMETVDRENNQQKINALLNQLMPFQDEMENNKRMQQLTVKISIEQLDQSRDWSNYFAFGIAFCVLAGYEYKLIPHVDEDGNTDETQDYTSTVTPQIGLAITIIGYIQGITASTLLIGYCMNYVTLVVRKGWRENCIEQTIKRPQDVLEINKLQSKFQGDIPLSKLSVEQARLVLAIEGPTSRTFSDKLLKKFNFGYRAVKFEYYWMCVTFLASDGQFLFTLIYLIFSLQGAFQSPVFYSFHLLDVTQRYVQLKTVMLSVTKNIDQLLFTGLLGIILLYIYASVAFQFIADTYYDDTLHGSLLNKKGDSVCFSMMSCFTSTVNYGVRMGGGIGEFLPAQTFVPENRLAYYIRFAYDLSFFLIIITILLNVIFGIIIDTFAQLRAERVQNERFIMTECFICGMEKSTLDRISSGGFKDHQDLDHNVWNYLYFIQHLNIKPSNDHNGIESLIFALMDEGNNSWFPQHTCLQHQKFTKGTKDSTQKTTQIALEKLNEKINTLEAAAVQLEDILDSK